MIARHRGEHDNHGGRWRPTAERHAAADEPHAPHAAPTDRPVLGRVAGRMRRRSRWVAALTAGAGVLLAGSWGIGQLRLRLAPPGLPSTPRAWLNAYEGAAIDNPGQVCSELFGPQLARAYAKSKQGSCRSYFREITSYSLIVRRVLEDHGTAVLELHQAVTPRDWAVVLSREHDGWQAVDLVPGKALR
jgi:hypothetical protein